VFDFHSSLKPFGGLTNRSVSTDSLLSTSNNSLGAITRPAL
jgi:hypothetical protein